MAKILPFGRTKVSGYSSSVTSEVETAILDQVLVAGSYTSGVFAQVVAVMLPLKASTRPSGSVLTLGYQRAYCMNAPWAQLLVSGLNRLMFLIPRFPLAVV